MKMARRPRSMAPRIMAQAISVLPPPVGHTSTRRFLPPLISRRRPSSAPSWYGRKDMALLTGGLRIAGTCREQLDVAISSVGEELDRAPSKHLSHAGSASVVR